MLIEQTRDPAPEEEENRRASALEHACMNVCDFPYQFTCVARKHSIKEPHIGFGPEKIHAVWDWWDSETRLDGFWEI